MQCSYLVKVKEMETKKIIGCITDSCPLGRGNLCCFECDNMEECRKSMNLCDELVELELKDLSKNQCEFYNSS